MKSPLVHPRLLHPSHALAATAAILAFAACSGQRSHTWIRGNIYSDQMAALSIGDKEALARVVTGSEHKLSWTLLPGHPVTTARHGFLASLPDESMVAVDNRGSDHSDEAINVPHSEPWVRVARGLGTLTVWARTEVGDPIAGTIDLAFAPDAIATLRDAGWQPTGRDAFRLLTTETTADELVAYRRSDSDLGLELACELASHDTDASDYASFASATEFDDLEVIKLLRYGVSLETTVAWYELGRQASVDELVYCRQHGVKPEHLQGWRAVDNELSFEQMSWARQRGVKPEHHRAWVEANHELDLENLYWVRQRRVTAAQYASWDSAGYRLEPEQLYWVKQRRVTPADYEAWATAGNTLDHEQLYWARQRGLKPQTWQQWLDAGKELTLDQLYWAKARGLKPSLGKQWREAGHDLDLEQLAMARAYGVDPQVAAAWRKIGYDPTIDELKDLRRFGIQPDYAERFLSPKYEAPTLEQLQEYRRHGKKPADVNHLRKPATSREG